MKFALVLDEVEKDEFRAAEADRCYPSGDCDCQDATVDVALEWKGIPSISAAAAFWAGMSLPASSLNSFTRVLISRARVSLVYRG